MLQQLSLPLLPIQLQFCPLRHSRHRSQFHTPSRCRLRQTWSKPTQKSYKNKSQNSRNKPKISNPHAFKKRGTCFVCGKPGHHAPQWKKRVKTGNNGNPPKANLVEGDDIIAAVISQANMVTNSKNWVVDFGATRHICANKMLLPPTLW